MVHAMEFELWGLTTNTTQDTLMEAENSEAAIHAKMLSLGM